MDNVQKVNHCANEPQTFSSQVYVMLWQIVLRFRQLDVVRVHRRYQAKQKYTDRGGWRTSNNIDLHSGGAWFKSLLGHDVRIVQTLRHDPFLRLTNHITESDVSQKQKPRSQHSQVKVKLSL
jgi:hypothetical protein